LFHVAAIAANSERRSKLGAVFRKYFALQAPIASYVENIVKQNYKGRHVLGIHVRATDYSNEYRETLIRPSEWIAATRRILSRMPAPRTIYLAADNQEIIDLFRKTAFDAKLVFSNAIRPQSYNASGWFNCNFNDKDCIQRAAAGIIEDIWLLSRCDELLYWEGAVSRVALMVNPSLASTSIRTLRQNASAETVLRQATPMKNTSNTSPIRIVGLIPEEPPAPAMEKVLSSDSAMLQTTLMAVSKESKDFVDANNDGLDDSYVPNCSKQRQIYSLLPMREKSQKGKPRSSDFFSSPAAGAGDEALTSAASLESPRAGAYVCESMRIGGLPEVQADCNGMYRITSQKLEGYPVYKSVSKKMFLYWTPTYGGQWQIDTDTDLVYKNVYIHTESGKPLKPPTLAKYWSPKTKKFEPVDLVVECVK
jgi:hypothetical protein